MDSVRKEGQTKAEELHHIKQINEPEDINNLEPDDQQYEARQAVGSLIWMLPISVVLVVLVVIFFVVMSL